MNRLERRGDNMTQPAALFYGTLRAAEVRKAVLGADLQPAQLQQAELNGYEVRRVDGALILC